MMGKLSRKTIQRLVMLYAIGRFPDGLSHQTLQKILYFATRKSSIRPFTFRHISEEQELREIADVKVKQTAMWEGK